MILFSIELKPKTAALLLPVLRNCLQHSRSATQSKFQVIQIEIASHMSGSSCCLARKSCAASLVARRLPSLACPSALSPLAHWGASPGCCAKLCDGGSDGIVQVQNSVFVYGASTEVYRRSSRDSYPSFVLGLEEGLNIGLDGISTCETMSPKMCLGAQIPAWLVRTF